MVVEGGSGGGFSGSTTSWAVERPLAGSASARLSASVPAGPKPPGIAQVRAWLHLLSSLLRKLEVEELVSRGGKVEESESRSDERARVFEKWMLPIKS